MTAFHWKAGLAPRPSMASRTRLSGSCCWQVARPWFSSTWPLAFIRLDWPPNGGLGVAVPEYKEAPSGPREAWAPELTQLRFPISTSQSEKQALSDSRDADQMANASNNHGSLGMVDPRLKPFPQALEAQGLSVRAPQCPRSSQVPPVLDSDLAFCEFTSYSALRTIYISSHPHANTCSRLDLRRMRRRRTSFW